MALFGNAIHEPPLPLQRERAAVGFLALDDHVVVGFQIHERELARLLAETFDGFRQLLEEHASSHVSHDSEAIDAEPGDGVCE